MPAPPPTIGTPTNPEPVDVVIAQPQPRRHGGIGSHGHRNRGRPGGGVLDVERQLEVGAERGEQLGQLGDVLREIGALDLGDVSSQPQAQLAKHLRERDLLLVLDNVEHLLEGCVQFVDLILRSSPDVAMLVTSRERLGMADDAFVAVMVA